MKNCEKCGTLHKGKYASGRFCGVKCAKSFATRINRAEINQRVSEKLKGRDVRLESIEKMFAIE
jgi:hypothetical protein